VRDSEDRNKEPDCEINVCRWNMRLSGNHAKLYKLKPVTSKLPSWLKFGVYSLRGVEGIVKPSSKFVTFRNEKDFSVALSYARLNQSSFGASRMNMSRDV
jgi:hypothetical protein